MGNASLSYRGERAYTTPLRVDLEEYFKEINNLYHKEKNPSGVFLLNMAENKLCWDVLKNKLENIAKDNKLSAWVSGYTSFLGDQEFRESVAIFLSKYLTKCTIKSNKIGFSAGATGVIEMTSFILAESGDVAVIPAPCYPAYKHDIGNISGVERFDLITHHDISELEDGPILDIAHLENALCKIKGDGKRFRMLIITNPDNPTGGIYSYHQLLNVAEWCIKKSIHLIVNEIYGLSLINMHESIIREDYKHECTFSSFASIMQSKESDFLHLWYAFSKDFGISGFRIGMLYSENKKLIKAYENLNLSHSVSNYTQWIIHLLLRDTTFLDSYISLNQKCLTASYIMVIQQLRKLKIPYVPSRGGLFVWLDLSEFLKNNSEEAEKELWWGLYKSKNILLTPGDGFGHSKRGLFRLVYSCVTTQVLEVVMQRFGNFVLEERKV